MINCSYGIFKCFSTKYKNNFIVVPSNETLLKPDKKILIYDSKTKQNKFEFSVKKEIIDIETICDRFIFVLTEGEVTQIDIQANFQSTTLKINA